MIEDLLQQEIETQLGLLKPEIKDWAVFNFDEVAKHNEKAMASHIGLKPSLITFHLKTMRRPLVRWIREIITHELIHSIQEVKSEPEAYEKQKKLNFFIE